MNTELTELWQQYDHLRSTSTSPKRNRKLRIAISMRTRHDYFATHRNSMLKRSLIHIHRKLKKCTSAVLVNNLRFLLIDD